MGSQRTAEHKRLPHGKPDLAGRTAQPAPQYDVGPVDDHYEQQADRIAAGVLARLAATGPVEQSGHASAGVQRTPADGSEAATDARSAPVVGAAGGPVGGDIARRIDSARRSGGAPMPSPLRRSMETAFEGADAAADFSGVRLHTGRESAQLNSALSARAFTVGKDIFLGSGAPGPETAAGQRMLAHELAHTQQQGGSARRTPVHRWGKKKSLPWAKGTTPDFSGKTAPGGGQLDEAVDSMQTTQSGTSSFGTFGDANEYRENINSAHGGKDSDVTGKWGDKETGNDIGYTANALSVFDLAVDVTRLVKVFKDEEADAGERAAAVFGLVGSAGKTANSMADTAKKAQDAAKGSTTDVAASIMAEIGSIVGTLQAAVELVKTIVTAIKDSSEQGGLAAKDAANRTFTAIRQALEVGKGVVETINKFMSHLGAVTTGLIQAVPALGIAMNCIDVLMNGFNIGHSWMAWAEMRTDKRSVKEELGGYGTNNNGGKPRWRNASYKDQAQQNIKGWDANKQQRHQDLTSNTARTTDEDRELAELTGMQGKAEKSKDYLASKELQYVAAKRIRRGALNIGLTLPAIAGDIAILSGVGAAVGAGLKAGSGIGKLLATGFRKAKQAVYNRISAKSVATGGEAHEKSEAGKLMRYEMVIDRVTAHVNHANGLADTTVAEKTAKQAAEAKALREISASGMSPMKMSYLMNAQKQTPKASKKNPNPATPTDKELGAKLYAEWIKALKER